MQRPINATLTFYSKNINFRRRMKYLELELLQLSELKIKLDDKLAIENFKKINEFIKMVRLQFYIFCFS